ncbi:hypothetical protein [Micromonospora sp. DPT]|uniref:hypothetical protein n=1 Tax=Micromonospora sp. DPT TaxID=3142975 RepID=UPI00320810CF
MAATAAAALAASTALTAPASADSSTNQYIVKFRAGTDRGAALRQLGERFGVNLAETRQLATLAGGQIAHVAELL